MSAPNVVLMEQARERRAKAFRVRKLFSLITDVQAQEVMKTYAAELESQAAELEAQATASADLAAEIGNEVDKATQLIADIKDTLSKI